MGGEFDVRRPVEITGMRFHAQDNRWRLHMSADNAAAELDGTKDTYDAIVLASGRPELAVSTIQELVDTSSEWDVDALMGATGVATSDLADRLSRLAGALKDLDG